MISGTAEPTFADLSQAPLRPPAAVCSWGRTLVVAPHPDDESLGCGGAIALLASSGCPVAVLFVSDGAGSHPNSRRFPPPALRALREREAVEALARLGAPEGAEMFLRLPDGSVPGTEALGFAEAVTQCRASLAAFGPETILLPWRRDPHPDHRATSQIVQAALKNPSPDFPTVRVLEYPIWAWERAAPGDAPTSQEVTAFRLDIRDVQAKKRAAVAAHESQVTHLIDDDPQGFWLSPEVLAHFERSWEVYLEVQSW